MYIIFFSSQADDDTFVDIPQLKKLLQKLDSTKNIYLGYVLRHGNRFWMSGGAGYIFSSAAFRTLIFSQFEDQTQYYTRLKFEKSAIKAIYIRVEMRYGGKLVSSKFALLFFEYENPRSFFFHFML